MNFPVKPVNKRSINGEALLQGTCGKTFSLIIRLMKKILCIVLLSMLLTGCSAGKAAVKQAATALPVILETGKIPNFDHIVVIVLENRDYSAVIGSEQMPYLNELASKNVLLTQYHAVAHPSLPNYIALISGSTFNIQSDCTDCMVNQASLPDLIEKSGRTWKAYEEDMPSPCFIGDAGNYMQKHDPFIYFDPIRKDAARCKSSVVPLPQINEDLKNGLFPNFAFITPNMCHDGHNCGLSVVDGWLKSEVDLLQGSPALGSRSLIAILFDEGLTGSDEACCGIPENGGRVAAVLISPQGKPAFQDSTPLSHYSLLKTIIRSWGLPDLNETANPAVSPIILPWK